MHEESSRRSGVVSFDDFELDESRFLLSRLGEPIRIEPRVFEVLVHLVRHRGRIVTKEELIDHVWRGTFVGESALTRCIKEARKAIGEQGRGAPLLKTIHGRGYRFEDAVTKVEPELHALSMPSPRTALPVETSIDASVPRHRRSWPRRASLLVTFTLLLTLVGDAHPRKPAMGGSDADVSTRVLLLPISPAEDVPELQLVALSIGDLLYQRLQGQPGLTFGFASTEETLHAPSLAELGRRSDARWLVSGSLRRAEGKEKAQLVVTLHEIRSLDDVRDTPLGRYDIPLLVKSADVSRFVNVRENIARRLLETLLPAIQRDPQESATPRDPEAYRLYLLAVSRLAASTCDGETAIELLRRSIEIDRDFAPAWEAYGWSHYSLISTCGADPKHYSEALRAADRALVLAPLRISAIGLKTTVLVETGRIEEAYEILRNAKARHPGSADLDAYLFNSLTYAGYLSEAESSLERLTASDANYLTQRGWSPTPYLFAGKTARFLQALPATDAPAFRYFRGFVEFSRGRRDMARRVLEPAFRLNPNDVYARLSLALLAVIDGDPEEARVILAQLARQREIVGRSDGEMTYRIAQLFVMTEDSDNGLRQLSLAVDQGFFCAACMERDPALASVRLDPRYRQIVDRARARHVAFGRRFGLHRAPARPVA